MLVLSGKTNEVIYVGKVKIIIGEMTKGRVKLIFDAPKDIKILREKLLK